MHPSPPRSSHADTASFSGTDPAATQPAQHPGKTPSRRRPLSRRKRPQPLERPTRESLSLAGLDAASRDWLRHGEIAGWSERTLGNRRELMTRFAWLLRHDGRETCDRDGIEAFMAYLQAPPPEGGRWGNPAANRPLRPRTCETYHGHLATFFAWAVADGRLDRSPMTSVPRPIARHDQIQPFSTEEVERLFEAARKGVYPARDRAILALLFDTGVRASELCALTGADHDPVGGRITVTGKGDKRRSPYYSRETQRLVRAFLRTLPEDWGPDDPLIPCQRGGHMSRSGLLQLFERLAHRAGLQGKRRSPHTCRHTFAIEFLRSWGSVFALQQALGHESLDMTRKYCAIAQNDVERETRQHSLVARLGRHRKR